MFVSQYALLLKKFIAYTCIVALINLVYTVILSSLVS
jgi:hypothetical protein